MQAYYEIETQIPPNHRLNLQLPDSIPAGTVKIAVIYELPEPSASKRSKMADFLAALPDVEPGAGLSREAIDARMQLERQDWD